MLEHLRQRAAAAMAQPDKVTLITFGPADLQSDVLPCRALHQQLYLLVRRTSDHLLNLEYRDTVLVTAPAWQLRGRACILAETKIPAALQTEDLPELDWSVWVSISPLRLTLFDPITHWFETLDFEIPGGEI